MRAWNSALSPSLFICGATGRREAPVWRAGAPGAASIQADAPSKLAQSKVIRQATMPVPSAVARLGRSVTTISLVMTAG